MTFAIGAAGTGGHVYPALAVADALVARGVATSDIVFFGGDRMEAVAVPAAGYDFVALEIRGLRRSLSRENLTLPAMVRRAARRAEHEMELRKTRVTTVFGGYVSVPVAWAARRLHTPVFLHEQNAVPGLANRLVARATRAAFVAFPAATKRLPRARVTGNPLRPAFATFDREALREPARRRYDLPPGVPVIGVLGGSQGARVLNEAAMRFAADADAGSVALVHLTGRAHLESVAPVAARSHHVWRTVAFEDEMEYFYAAADVVLSRAGALTISELAATGTPAIVVPYAAGTAGHQAANAAELGAAGGVILIPEEEIDRVPAEIQQLLLDGSRRLAMGRAAARLGHPGAAAEIAGALVEAVDG
jgi:UDP-N-acetylglucosamine--N-acetylmuramyl-(pentapeptide) pyrophosphoryl-undecaprenol N-acetylglucosamine transferase